MNVCIYCDFDHFRFNLWVLNICQANLTTLIDSRARNEQKETDSSLDQEEDVVDASIPPAFILEGSDNAPSDNSRSPAPGSSTGTSLELDKTRLSVTKRSETSQDRDIGGNAIIRVGHSPLFLQLNVSKCFICLPMVY